MLFGSLPTKEQLKTFVEILSSLQELSGQFVRDVIMKAPSANLMNGLQKSVLTLYSYDSNPDDISVGNAKIIAKALHESVDTIFFNNESTKCRK